MFTLLLLALTLTTPEPWHDLRAAPEVSLAAHVVRQMEPLQRTFKAYHAECLQRINAQTLRERELRQYWPWCPLPAEAAE